MAGKVFYPLTSPQLSIWYTEKMYPGISISNVAGTLRINQQIDFKLMEQAINYFIKHNDGIRLRICLDENGNPRQYVSDYIYETIEFMDFSAYAQPEKALYEWDSIETRKPFELLDSALYRFVIVKIHENDWGVYFNNHHIISDAWSMSLIASSVLNYYNKIKAGTEDVLCPPSPSYTDYIQCEEKYFSSPRFIKDEAYWSQIFESAPDCTVLKRRIANIKSTQCKRKTFVAPDKFTTLLKRYCDENKISPFPLFLAALSMYIYRITDKEDIVIGTPILNRLNINEKKTFGMFISTIPLRIKITGASSFMDLCSDLLQLLSSSFKHQRYPYEKILSHVREKHGISENLYDIVLSYQNSRFAREDTLSRTRWHFCGHQSNSLTIHINDRDNDGILIIDYDYQTDLYHEKEIEFLHKHMLNLLWHALDNPQKEICRTEMLLENEKKKVLGTFNKTYKEYPRNKLIQQLFEEQVLKNPDQTALCFEDTAITYAELNHRINQLAWALRKKLTEPNQLVGIMARRSIEMIVGIFAIIKAGGAYVPIDPEYPSDRIRLILEDSRIKLLLTTGNLASGDLHHIEKIDIFDKDVYASETGMNLPYINRSSDLVYMIYTSGSTCKPKGVMIEHKSLHNFIMGVKNVLEFDESSRVLSVTTICFDIFVFEVFTSLLSGSTVVLANHDEQMIPHMFSNLITKHQVTTLLMTPSRLKLFIGYGDPSIWMKSVRQIMLGGETLDLHLLLKLRTVTNARIINGYGPTEITIGATFKDMTDSSIVTIGKPIQNTRIYILDKHLNPLPIGIQGELYIAGDGLARGYHNRPELTKERFIPNPFSPGERLYKSGDLARWYPKGDIEFLGRKDSQVKIRGYRVELGEIENAILQYNGIDKVLVQLRKNDLYGDFLCAYYISDNDLDINSLKIFLASRIPRYMIPRFFVRLNSIPVNANGKADYSKLPDAGFPKNKESELVLPANPLEAKILSMVCDILNIETFSVEENLLDYGMDSLAIVLFISHLHKEGINISTRDVYEHPTVRQLYRLISNNMNKLSRVDSC